MTGENPEILHANNKKIDFRYSFEISGFKKSAGKGSIIVNDQLTDEEIKKLINEFVLKKIRKFLKGKTIALDQNFAINTHVEIRKVSRVSPWNNINLAADESGQVSSRKYVVFILGFALVILMFLFVLLNNPSFSPVK